MKILEFQKLDYWEKIDYIENWKVNPNEQMLFYTIFENEINSAKVELIISLFECATYNKIYLKNIEEWCWDKLLNKSHFLIKLSILDYLMGDKAKIHGNKLDMLRELLNRRNFLIVKNQILILLIATDNHNRLVDKATLIKNMAFTKDYRAHIRIYKEILNNNLISLFTKDDFKKMFSYTDKHDFNSRTLSKEIDNIRSTFHAIPR